MEQRLCNLIIQSPGGNASKGANSYKIALPSTWVDEMGVGTDNRQLVLSFDGKSITVSMPLSVLTFLEQGRKAGDHLLLLSYFNENTSCTKIAVNCDSRRICIENLVENPLLTAFGNNQLPSWEDYLDFLESRCIPRERAGIQSYLETIGVDAYNALDIIRKTEGRMAEDRQWLKVEEVE